MHTLRPVLTPLFALALAGFVLAGCSSVDSTPADPNPMPHDTLKGPGLFTGDDGEGSILDIFKSNKGSAATSALAVNGYLWRASLETVSFMPILQADSAGGVIATDWYTDPNHTNVRYKLTVLIKGMALRPNGVEVKVFKQTGKDGVWTAAPVDPSTARKLEDTILTKARILRVQDTAAK